MFPSLPACEPVDNKKLKWWVAWKNIQKQSLDLCVKPGMVVYACNSITPETQTRGPRIQGHPWLDGECETVRTACGAWDCFEKLTK